MSSTRNFDSAAAVAVTAVTVTAVTVTGGEAQQQQSYKAESENDAHVPVRLAGSSGLVDAVVAGATKWKCCSCCYVQVHCCSSSDQNSDDEQDPQWI